MEKRHYERPAMGVIVLQHRQQLLNGSGQGMSGEISGYKKSSGGFSQDSQVKSQGSHDVWDEDWSQ